MLPAVKGTYDRGKIVLSEPSPVTDKTEVIVTFLDKIKPAAKSAVRKLGGLEGKVNLPADFNEPLIDLKDYM